MRILIFLTVGVFVGLLTGWLGGFLSGSRPSGPEFARRSTGFPTAPPGPGSVGFKSPEEELRHWLSRPAGVRNAIRMEQAVLQMSQVEAFGLLRRLSFKETDFTAFLLGWQASETNPPEVLAALEGGTVPPGPTKSDSLPAKAGILQRWLTQDQSAALSGCRNNPKQWPLVLKQWAASDPAACANFLLREPDAPVPDLLDFWTARDPAAALSWTAAHHPDWQGALFKHWILAEAPAALPVALGQDWGQPHPSPLDSGLVGGFSLLAKTNPELAAATLRRIEPERLTRQLYPADAILSSMAGGDPGLCMSLAESTESQELRDRILAACVTELYDHDIAEALKMARSMKSPEWRGFALGNITHQLAELDPRAAEPLFAELPPNRRAMTMSDLLEDFDASAPALAEKCRQWLADYEASKSK